MTAKNQPKSSGVGRGGARPGAGRPKGAETRKTRLLAERAAAEGLLPLEYLLRLLRDETAPAPMRFEAAKAAARYCHPALSAVEMKGTGMQPVPALSISPDALAEIIQKLQKEI